MADVVPLPAGRVWLGRHGGVRPRRAAGDQYDWWHLRDAYAAAYIDAVQKETPRTEKPPTSTSTRS